MAENVIFNVTKSNIFFNDEFGELKIEKEIFDETEFIFEADDFEGLSEEYMEAEFQGMEEEGQILEKMEKVMEIEYTEGGGDVNINDVDINSKFPNDGYVNKLNSTQKSNLKLIVEACKSRGVTNQFAIAATIAICSKESNLTPQSENGKYREATIKKVWPRLASRASELAGNPSKLFNVAYSDKYGNGSESSGDGFKYRGRGFNQITFKDLYKKYGTRIGQDLVRTPDKLNIPSVAASVLVEYNKSCFLSLSKAKLKDYNSTGINDFKNTTDAVLAFYHITAGVGHPTSYVKGLLIKDHLGGLTKAMKRVNPILEYIKREGLI